MIADRIVHQRAPAAIGHVVEFDAQLIAKLRHRQMAKAAGADRPIGDAPRLGLRRRNDIAK